MMPVVFSHTTLANATKAEPINCICICSQKAELWDEMTEERGGGCLRSDILGGGRGGDEEDEEREEGGEEDV